MIGDSPRTARRRRTVSAALIGSLVGLAGSVVTAVPAEAAVGSLTWASVAVNGVGGVSGIDGAIDVAVSPDGTSVYVAGTGSSSVTAFSRNASTGALAQIDIETNGVGLVDGIGSARGVAVSPNGQNVYVTGNSEDGIATFARNPNGTLDYVSRLEDGDPGIDGLNGAWAVAVAPDGKDVYVTADGDSSITTFSRDTGSGALTWRQTVKDGDPGVTGLQFATGVAVSPDDNDVYVTGCGDNAVSVFDRTGVFGELTFNEMEKQGVAGVDGITCARGVAVAPNGVSVSVVGETSDAVATFTRTPANGTIGYLGTVKDGVGGVDGLDGARDLAYTADSAGLYVASLVDDAVASFIANTGTGALTFVEVDRDGVGGVEGLSDANGVAVPLDGKHVYVTGQADDAAATFVRTLTDPQPPAPASRSISFKASKKTVVKGKKVKLTGSVTAATAPACAAGQTLQVQRSTKGATYKTIRSLVTTSDGAFKTKVKMRKKSRFRFALTASGTCASAQSAPRTVRVTKPKPKP